MIDAIFWLIILISFVIYFLITIVYKKYDRFTNKDKLTGFDVALKVTKKCKLEDVIIIETRKKYNDSYDGTRNVIKLSTPVFHNDSILSLIVGTYMASMLVGEKNNNLNKYIGIFVNTIVRYIIFIAYILVLLGAISGVFAIKTMGIFMLLAVFLFLIYYLRQKYYILDDAKEKIKKGLRKSENADKVLLLLLLKDFTIYVSVFIDIYEEIMYYIKKN